LPAFFEPHPFPETHLFPEIHLLPMPGSYPRVRAAALVVVLLLCLCGQECVSLRLREGREPVEADQDDKNKDAIKEMMKEGKADIEDSTKRMLQENLDKVEERVAKEKVAEEEVKKQRTEQDKQQLALARAADTRNARMAKIEKEQVRPRSMSEGLGGEGWGYQGASRAVCVCGALCAFEL
jgi:hypothetical protein